nr:hypothetical protein [Sicyoidochytrium minutum DNA virus]
MMIRESETLRQGRDWMYFSLVVLMGILFFYFVVLATCQYFGVAIPNIMWTVGDVIAVLAMMFFAFKVLLVTIALRDIYVSVAEQGTKTARRATYFIAFIFAFITLVIGIAGSSRTFASLGIAT